jgi:hypothetical protein
VTDLLGPRPDPVDELVCSARGCRDDATWGLLWNNPRLHTPERRKVWLACDAHREHLEAFLGARSFLRDTVPVQDLDRSGEDRASDPRSRTAAPPGGPSA